MMEKKGQLEIMRANVRRRTFIILLASFLIYLISLNTLADVINNKVFYSINEKFQIFEHGEVALDKAYEIIDEYIENQKGLKGLKGGAGYVISKSMFGFSIDDKTFIELYIDDEEFYRIKFECPEPTSRRRIYQKEINIKDRNTLKKIVEEFYKKDTSDFKVYFNSLENEY
ncbi:hypothetical protein ACFL2I_07045 [Candidatus Omnitrophota bacterium]